MAKPKIPAHLEVTADEFRSTLNQLWSVLRQLEDPEIFAECYTEEVRFSTRPGQFTTFEHIITRFGSIRLLNAYDGLQLEFTPPKGDTVLLRIPQCGFYNDQSGSYDSSMVKACKSRKQLKLLATALTALHQHLDDEIVSLDGNRAVIGIPGAVDEVSLKTIATMIHLSTLAREAAQGCSGHEHKTRAWTEVRAPYLLRGLAQESSSYSIGHAYFNDMNPFLRQQIGMFLKPRVVARASRPRWKGTREALYLWEIQLGADKVSISDRHNWLSEDVVLGPADVAAAEALAERLGFTIGGEVPRQPLALAA